MGFTYPKVGMGKVGWVQRTVTWNDLDRTLKMHK